MDRLKTVSPQGLAASLNLEGKAWLNEWISEIFSLGQDFSRVAESVVLILYVGLTTGLHEAMPVKPQEHVA